MRYQTPCLKRNFQRYLAFLVYVFLSPACALAELALSLQLPIVLQAPLVCRPASCLAFQYLRVCPLVGSFAPPAELNALIKCLNKSIEGEGYVGFFKVGFVTAAMNREGATGVIGG